MDWSKVYKQVEKSVVSIIQINYKNEVQSIATGVIVADGSKILTCAHCVSENFINVIHFKEENKFINGNVIFLDINNDIAILDTKIIIGNAAKIKSSSSIEIGNEVFIVGFPYKMSSEKTLTAGNIAAFEDGLIKIDTSVNNGNSGGPLFNKNGEIIGIVNLKLGSFSKFLDNVENSQSNTYMSIGGIDPIKTIKQMIKEMKINLNLGIGYAIPTDKIAEISTIIKNCIIL